MLDSKPGLFAPKTNRPLQQPLEKLDPKQVANLDKAINNAEEFASEVLQRITKPEVIV